MNFESMPSDSPSGSANRRGRRKERGVARCRHKGETNRAVGGKEKPLR